MHQLRNKLCEALLIPFVLLGIFWAFLGKYLGGDYSIATWLDNTHFLLPLFSHFSRSFAAGDFPYWINSIAGGVPLYNTPQFSPLYPFYFLGWNLYRSPLDALLQVHYVTLLHVGILWACTYVMLRIFHLRVVSSVLGATLFAFSANTYAYLFWVNVISPYSWLPLALGSVFLVLENESPRTGLLLGWISIYLLVSASASQPLIHFVYCAAFLAASYGIVRRRDLSNLKTPLRNIVLLAVGSIVLSSAVLIPTFIYSQRDMVRWTDAGAVVGNQHIPFSGLLLGQAQPAELAKVLFPLPIEPTTGDSYLGILTVFLACFGLFRWKQNWLVLPLLILGVYALLSSAGTHLGLAYINYWLPLLNKIREPGRHLYVFALAACSLAAFGFEHLTQSERLRGLRNHLLAVGSFLILLLGSYWIRQRYETAISDSILLWPLVAFITVLAAVRFFKLSNHAAQALLAVIVIYPALRNPVPIVKVQQGDYFEEANLRSHRVLQELAKIGGIRNYRLIVADSQFNPQYWSMNGAYYGLRTFEAFMNPLPLSATQEMFTAPLLPRYAQLLGARYYLACGNAPPPIASYSLEREIEGCRLYSSADAQPHFFLSTEVGLAYSNVQQFLDRLHRTDADLNKLSISSKDAPVLAHWLGDVPVPLQLDTLGEEHSVNTFKVDLKTNRKSVLVLNEYFRNEWQVTLNGKSVKPLKVNLNQIGVLLPAGANQVHFEYRPRLFIWLLYVQRAGFLLVITGVIVAVAKARRAGRP